MRTPGGKIWRPRQVYVGEARRDYRPMPERHDKNKHGSIAERHPFSKRTMAASWKHKPDNLK